MAVVTPGPADMAAAATALASGRLPEPAVLQVVVELIRRHASPQRPETASGRRAERDRLLRRLRDGHFAEFGPTRAADELRIAVGRYEASGWQRDRTALVCPHPPDGLYALAWAILRLGTDLPGRRRLIDILAE